MLHPDKRELQRVDRGIHPASLPAAQTAPVTATDRSNISATGPSSAFLVFDKLVR
jgi:hypothetical protein